MKSLIIMNIVKTASKFLVLTIILSSCSIINNIGNRTDNRNTGRFPADSYFDGPMAIKWDVFNASHGAQYLPAAGKIAGELNDRFNVEMDSVVVRGLQNTHTEQPDIFRINLHNKQIENEIIESGAVRAVPWDMIERHAPRYAALIGQNRLLREQYTVVGNETYVLFGLEKIPDMLRTFSVYRYDWLERYGIEPHGNVTQISEYMYFTDDAFTEDEFISIMVKFSGHESRGRIGLATYALVSDGVDPLMGMFGLNRDNIYESGEAVFYGASGNFHSFLVFIESLINMGVMSTKMDYASDALITSVGWWTMDILNITHLIRTLDYAANSGDPNFEEMKVLLAPPEIGYDGQGVHSPVANQIIPTEKYMISASVSDDKLEKILEIFDAISFDPELYVLTKYGIEGEDFAWTGEPYNSYIEIFDYRDISRRRIFHINTIDGVAGKYIYEFFSEELYRFATSPEARAMNIPPYKSDPYGLYAPEMNALFVKYGTPLHELAAAYYYEIASGNKTVSDSWDDYMASLNAHGLAEYTELIGNFPVTNRR